KEGIGALISECSYSSYLTDGYERLCKNPGEVIQLDPKNTEASQEIGRIEEEKKKRAEVEAKTGKIFDYYRKAVFRELSTIKPQELSGTLFPS
ncbi:MAG TPA: hypothetical protein VHT73_19010, partial [Thermodesulfobacteriota bacterium]|nr:hypothetical protein [Thermodesulfobacteriota bacterium]